THQAADLGAQRIVTLRVFDGNIHRLGLLALCEAAVAIVGLYAAIFIRFAGSSATLAAFEASRGPFWPRALTIAGAFMVALAALGLYQLRHRTRFTAVFVRLLIAMAVAQVALGLLFYAAPTLDVGRGVMGLTGAFTLAGLAITRFAFLRMVDEEFLSGACWYGAREPVRAPSASGFGGAPTSAASASWAMCGRRETA